MFKTGPVRDRLVDEVYSYVQSLGVSRCGKVLAIYPDPEYVAKA